jgi:hypothetical protein
MRKILQRNEQVEGMGLAIKAELTPRAAAVLEDAGSSRRFVRLL